MTTPLEFSWELIALAVGSGGNRGARRFRLRVRTERGEKAVDLSAGDLPAAIAELCTRLGIEGVTMDNDFDLSKLATMKREQLDDLDRELAELSGKRQRLVREVKAIEKCAAMLDGGAERPKRGGGRRRVDDTAKESPSEKILAALTKKGGPLTVSELCEATGLQPAAVGVTCRHMVNSGKVRRDGDAVRLAKPAGAAA